MSDTPPPAVSVRRGAPPPIHWRSWPLEEGGLSAWLLSGIAALVIVAAGFGTGSAQWALVACGALAVAAWRFFVPTHFELSAQGISQEVLGRQRRIAWRAFETSEICREGVFLRPARGVLPFTRGLYVPWGAHRAEVLAFVDYYLGQVRQSSRATDFSHG
jgi:hypothetical protein